MTSVLRKTIIAVAAIAVSFATLDAQVADGNAASERVSSAAGYSRDRAGIAMLVIKGDAIVFEEYHFPLNANRPWMLASGTKSFAGVMCAAAIEDKLISGFDEKVSETITEWKNDPGKAKITIREILTLTSGIDAGVSGLTVPSYAAAVRMPVKYEPSKRFEYGPVPFQVFGEVMTRKLKPKNDTVMNYLKRRILDPIGLNISSWRTLDGQPLLPQGAVLTAREWAKFGRLLKGRGKWKGKQIIDAKLLGELVKGSKANPAYGISFWLNAAGTGPSGNVRPTLFDSKAGHESKGSDVFMAAGLGNQRLYVIPSLDMVIVRFGIFGDFDDAAFLSHIIPKN